MAIWGIGVMVGPIMGPTLGGYLTETLQLALGVLRQPAVRHPGRSPGMLLFMPKTRARSRSCASTGSASPCSRWASARLQLMLDRGQNQDWFTSREIIIEAVLAGLGFYLFVVHMFTAREAVHPAGAVQGPQLRRRRA